MIRCAMTATPSITSMSSSSQSSSNAAADGCSRAALAASLGLLSPWPPQRAEALALLSQQGSCASNSLVIGTSWWLSCSSGAALNLLCVVCRTGTVNLLAHSPVFQMLTQQLLTLLPHPVLANSQAAKGVSGQQGTVSQNSNSQHSQQQRRRLSAHEVRTLCGVLLPSMVSQLCVGQLHGHAAVLVCARFGTHGACSSLGGGVLLLLEKVLRSFTTREAAAAVAAAVATVALKDGASEGLGVGTYTSLGDGDDGGDDTPLAVLRSLEVVAALVTAACTEALQVLVEDQR